MKKSLLALGAAAMLMAVSSCKNDSDSKASQQADPSTAATEQAAPSPAETNAKAGAEYLQKLKAEDQDVKFTETGLGYKVIKEGKGAKPAPTSTVSVKYTGKHIDGSVFDSSNGETVDFPLNKVIPGFTQGIEMMNKGAVYELYIPSDLAYGEYGAPGAIGPNETIIFEVELVDIK